MDISVSLDSFSLLKLGLLKCTNDHFDQHSVYAQSIRKLLDRSRLKWQRVARLLTRPETAVLLHPVMRSLGQMYVRRRRLKLKLSLIKKLIRRSRRSRTLPSFRPFMCQRCSLSSFRLNVIKRHECRRRRYKAFNSDELEKAAYLGLRSGIRNAMSVLEMTEHPNKVRLPPLAKSQYPSKLEKSLPIRKNQKVPNEFRNSNTVEVVQEVNENASFVECAESSHLASLCLTCRRSFSSPTDYKQHEGCTKSNELKFLVRNFHRFPSAGIELPPSGQTLDSLISMLCYNCSRADFRDSNAFHEHIMNCT